MENAIKFLRIQNFKSIKDVTIHPRRVNLIIGEPNVGKSNLLEAMTLLGGIVYEQTEKFMGSFIRYEEPRQLFYNNLLSNAIRLITDKERVILGVREHDSQLIFLVISADAQDEFFSQTKLPQISTPEQVERGLMLNFFKEFRRPEFDFSDQARFAYSEITNSGGYNVPGSPDNVAISQTPQNSWSIKPYSFAKNTVINKEYGHSFLRPPYGNNLITVIQNFSKLRFEISRLFEGYGQKPYIRMDTRHFEIMEEQDGFIYSYPYSSVADTLQRIIFYLAAIESNDDAVLLFEEPEAHSFPVYVAKLGRRIVESTNNQFFIDTHSPYLITEILEKMLTDETQEGELAIFAAYYEDHQTKVHQLSDEEIRSIRNDGIDVFYNMKRFTTGTADA